MDIGNAEQMRRAVEIVNRQQAIQKIGNIRSTLSQLEGKLALARD